MDICCSVLENSYTQLFSFVSIVWAIFKWVPIWGLLNISGHANILSLAQSKMYLEICHLDLNLISIVKEIQSVFLMCLRWVKMLLNKSYLISPDLLTVGKVFRKDALILWDQARLSQDLKLYSWSYHWLTSGLSLNHLPVWDQNLFSYRENKIWSFLK